MLLKNSRAFAAGIGSVLFWSIIPTIIKIGIHELPVLFLLLLRFAISVGLLIPITRIKISRLKEVSTRDWLLLQILLTINLALQAIALNDLPAIWYLLIFSLSPLVSLVILRTRPKPQSMIGIALAVVGTAWFLSSSRITGAFPVLALLAMVGSMLTWSLYLPIVRKVQKAFSDIETVTITNTMSFGAAIGLWLLHGSPVASLNQTACLSVLALGLLIPFSYWLLFYCLRRLPVFGVTSQYLEPVFGTVFALVILGETISAAQVVGGVAILAGVGLIRE